MCYQYSVPGDKTLSKRFNIKIDDDEHFERTYHANSFSLPKLPVITNSKPKKFNTQPLFLIR